MAMMPRDTNAPPDGVPAEPTALYRLFDADDELLYVGIANDPEQRWKAHTRTAAWWPQVARKSVEWFDSRPEAAAAEASAITAEAPAHNVVHNHERHARTRAECDAIRNDPRLKCMTAEEKVAFFAEHGLDADARYWQHVVEVVSQAPPLAPEQISRLRVLIWGSAAQQESHS